MAELLCPLFRLPQSYADFFAYDMHTQLTTGTLHGRWICRGIHPGRRCRPFQHPSHLERPRGTQAKAKYKYPNYDINISIGQRLHSLLI